MAETYTHTHISSLTEETRLRLSWILLTLLAGLAACRGSNANHPKAETDGLLLITSAGRPAAKVPEPEKKPEPEPEPDPPDLPPSSFETVVINIYPERFIIEPRQPFAVIQARFSDLAPADTVIWSLAASGGDNALFRIGDSRGNWQPDGDANADGRIGLYLKAITAFDY